MMLVLALGLYCGGCTAGGSRGGITYRPANGGQGAAGAPQQSQSGARTTGDILGGTPPGDGSPNSGGLGLGGGGLGPIGDPQDLRDLGGEPIHPWGPILATHIVQTPGGPVTVNELDDGDPFTATYQLPDGTIARSNEPLGQVVVQPGLGDPPPTEEWTDGQGRTWQIFTDEIIVDFLPTATQQDIEQLMAAHNLQVILSFFQGPDEPGLGNSIALMRFQYDPEEFPTFRQAYAYFNSLPLVDEVTPDIANCFTPDYVQGEPVDYWYDWEHNKQVELLGVGPGSQVDIGPPNGSQDLSTQAVCVIDDGVWRWHPDFTIPNKPSTYRKISEVGIAIGWKRHYLGKGYGEPTQDDPHRGGTRSHGTMVAGEITATSTTQQQYSWGVAGLGPRANIVSIMMPMEGDNFTWWSFAEAIYGLTAYFKKDCWVNNVRVVNMSFSSPAAENCWGKALNHDLKYTDRLYVASAPNNLLMEKGYPAAFPTVLGVTGLWTDQNGENWYAWYPAHEGSLKGSSYWNSSTYPVSGIWCYTEFWDGRYYHYNYGEFGRTTSIPGTILKPGTDTPWGYYDMLWGNSAACPQVAALGFLLYDRHPEYSMRYPQVRQRIITTRDDTKARGALAGLVNYAVALAGW